MSPKVRSRGASNARLVRPVLVLLLVGAASYACNSSSSSGGAPADGGSEAAIASDAASAIDAFQPSFDANGGDDAGSKPDASPASFVISKASVTELDSSYPLILFKLNNGAETAYNGAYPDNPAGNLVPPRIEMEIVIDTATMKIKRAHIWDYDQVTGMNVDKTWGCDQSVTLPCTGITIDDANKKITFASVTWKEVTPDLAGMMPDTVVVGGGSLTMDGYATIK